MVGASQLAASCGEGGEACYTHYFGQNRSVHLSLGIGHELLDFRFADFDQNSGELLQ